ncbi:MAG: hypothetical protein J6T62_05205 [Fibrobacter sp.]|nr:hypothetical protein [Fibrobacter sp.]
MPIVVGKKRACCRYKQQERGKKESANIFEAMLGQGQFELFDVALNIEKKALNQLSKISTGCRARLWGLPTGPGIGVENSISGIDNRRCQIYIHSEQMF